MLLLALFQTGEVYEPLRAWPQRRVAGATTVAGQQTRSGMKFRALAKPRRDAGADCDKRLHPPDVL